MPQKRDESFSRENRLRNTQDFKRVFSRGRRASTPFFVLYILPNELPQSRLGIQLKAKLGTAVRRNYSKRIVREIFRKMKSRFSVPVDIIFIGEKGILDLKYRDLENELCKSLQRYLT